MLRHISRNPTGLLSGPLRIQVGPEHLWVLVATSSAVTSVLQAAHLPGFLPGEVKAPHNK